MTVQSRYDFIEIKAVVTPEGWIRDKPVITRSGIFEYRDRKGKTIKEWRPEEEVFKADSLATLAGIPVTDNHQGMVNADNTSPIIGTVVSQGIKQDNNVVAEIIIHNPKKLGAKRELSLGYRATVIEEPGVTPDGQHYDSKQTNIVYNHLAAVISGRAGNARLRLDGNDAASGNFSMEDEVSEPKLVMVRLDSGIEYQAAQEVANAFLRLVDEAKAKKTELDQKQAELDVIKSQHAEIETVLAEIVADSVDKPKKLVDIAKFVAGEYKTMPERIRARSELEEIAKKHALKFDAKTTDRNLREQIVNKIRGDSIKFDGKSDDYVTSAYDIALGLDADKVKKIGEQRVASNPNSNNSNPKQGGAAAARTRMVAGIRAGR